MHIVIDLQGAQCESRFRGIGRYSLSLAKFIARNRGNHRVTVALNSVFSDSVDALSAEFEDILPPGSVRVWRGLELVHGRDPNNDWRRQASEQIFEAFLDELAPDAVLISSLFEGYADDAVSSVPSCVRRWATGVILYDLIPLIYKDNYLTNGLVSSWYQRKLENLGRADFLLAISESSGREAREYLDYPADRIANISGAADPKFRPLEVDTGEAQQLRSAFGISRPFVLCAPGGFDHHKNVDGLIQAWGRLPEQLRKSHQLVIASRIQRATERRLEKTCKKAGLKSSDVIFTGYVPDFDLVRLYNLTDLCVFPSRHEGFGLPALEAMSCGAPTIGSNSSAVPEVIGREDALFDPEDTQAIAGLIGDLLNSPERRADLSRFGLEQSSRFSWDRSARLAIDGLERQLGGRTVSPTPSVRPHRLAIVAAEADLRGGAAHSLIALLPELAWRYRIDVVPCCGPIRPADMPDGVSACLSPDEFRRSAGSYDRVLHCLGGGSVDEVATMALDVPGVVLLSDPDLTGRLDRATDTEARVSLLRRNRGFVDFEGRQTPLSRTTTAAKLLIHDIVARARGVVAGHQAVSKAATTSGVPGAENWPVLTFSHESADFERLSLSEARSRLGLDENRPTLAVLCDPPFDKALLDAVRTCENAAPAGTQLLVLDSRSPQDRERLGAKIAVGSLGRDVVTLLDPAHRPTLAAVAGAADGAIAFGSTVQTSTSCSLFDLAGAGLNVVAADMAPSVSDAIDAALSGEIGAWSAKRPSPPDDIQSVASSLVDAIEHIYTKNGIGLSEATRAIASLKQKPYDKDDWARAAEALSYTFPATQAPRQLLVDVSELSQRDARSGVQRVVRNVLRAWLRNPPEGYQVQPVYATTHHGYRYATRFTLNFLGHHVGEVEDEEIDVAPGDILFVLDLQHHTAEAQRSFYKKVRHHGVKVYFLVHDLLPILLDGIFPPHMRTLHEDWLSVVAESDGAFCVSRSVADELSDWIRDTGRLTPHPFHIGWFHHGSDFTGSTSWTGLPPDAEEVLAQLKSRPTFLMVGTIEPRKGHAQTLDAMEVLWAKGVDVNLAVVGKEGWLVQDVVKRLRNHKERGKRLFWLEGVSDEYLERAYATSACLIAASRGEGFGLPLIEAAQYTVPIVARDIPVFREVAGDHAFFFSAHNGSAMAGALEDWLALYRAGKHPKSDAMPRLTWEQTAARLLKAIVEEDFYLELRQPKPDPLPET